MAAFPDQNHMTKEETEFAVFCIENLALRLKKEPSKVYSMLTENSDLLYSYIVPCFDSLHTQDRDYVVSDIIAAMRERGLPV